LNPDQDVENLSGMEIWLSDISYDSATRFAGAIMIIIGSILGILFGILTISANPNEILSGSLDGDDNFANIAGIANTALIDNNTGGDPLEGVKITLLNDDGTVTGKETYTDSSGRFSFVDVIRESKIIYATYSDNISVRILFIPGDHAQIPITMTPGDEEEIKEIDWRGASQLGDSAYLATVIAIFTLISGFIGFLGGLEALNGNSYRKAWWFSFIGLWSRGGLFIGPLMILIGMGISSLTKNQFKSNMINDD
jgi:hypothetical protein|tara:strand:+ start:255 stop:1013 length:759 start_codon:yes stop_codon:yes gene_type:complete